MYLILKLQNLEPENVWHIIAWIFKFEFNLNSYEALQKKENKLFIKNIPFYFYMNRHESLQY